MMTFTRILPGPNRTVAEKLLFAAMVAGSVAVIILASLPTPVALSHFVIEDMFYYLTAARNIVDGHPASLDGTSPTNGFHPLWMLICVGIQAVFPGHPDIAFRAALLLCAALFIATGWLLYSVVRRAAGETLALAVGALFLCSYRLIAIALGGLESALYGLTIVILLRWLYARGAEGLRSLRDATMLGLLLSLTYYSRMDALLLGVFVCLGMVLFTSGRQPLERVRLAVAAGLVSLIMLVPWFAYSAATVGSLLPRSGTAIRSWRNTTPSGGSLVDRLVDTVHAQLGGAIEPINDIANVLGVWPFTPGHSGLLRIVGAGVGLLAFLAVCAIVIFSRKAPSLQPFRWIPLYAAAHAGYYLVTLTPDIRYLYPVFILMLFYVAVGLKSMQDERGSALLSDRSIVRTAFVMLLCSLIAGVSAFQHGYATGRAHSLHMALYADISPWIRSHTEPDALVGGFNSGIVSYYSGRRVVNLDGVMNDAAIPPIETHTLSQYIDDRGIEYLTDVESEVTRFMDGFSGDQNWRADWHEVYSVTIPTVGGTENTRFVVLQRNEPQSTD
jgi:hypothetical protein